MKTAIACAAALLAIASSAGAQEAPQYPVVRPLLGVGLTYGGDTLATVYYTNGDTRDIRAGNLFAVYGGADFRLGPQFSMQGTIGYHVDNTSGSNGSLRFERFPIEGLAYFHATEHFRFGAGLRYATQPRLTGTGVLSGGEVKFDNALGAIVEGEYAFNPHFGLKVRAVSEKYKVQGGGPSIDGSHIGVYSNFYF